MVAFSSFNARGRAYQTLAYLSIFIAALGLIVAPLPDGPWVGVYDSFAVTWLSLVIGALFMLIAIGRGVSWTSLVVFGMIYIATVVGISLQWGWLHGQHDAWHHLYLVTFRVFGAPENPYPAFHIGISGGATVLGVSDLTALRYSTLLASVLGVFGLAILLRRLSFPETACKRAFVAGLPAVLFMFIQRPFTLAWPFMLIVGWLIFAEIGQRRTYSLVVLFGISLVAIHVQIPTFAIAFFVSGMLATAIQPHIPETYRGVQLPFDFRQFFSMLSVYAFVVFAYLFFITDIGAKLWDTFNGIVGDSMSSSPPEATTSTPVDTPQPPTTSTETPPHSTIDNNQTPAGGDQGIPTASGIQRRQRKPSLIARILRQPSVITEVIARLSYILLLGMAMMGSLIEEWHDRAVSSNTLLFVLIAAQFGVFFVFVDLVLHSTIINVRRAVQMLPLLLAPGIVYILRSRRARMRWIPTMLALLILSSGLIVAYHSSYTGSVSFAATDQQVKGVEWIGQHNVDRPVVGVSMTFWIAEGLFGPDRIFAWATRDQSPKWTVRLRDGYSWQVRNPDGLIVIDEVSRTLANREYRESGDRTALRDLETMPIRESKVYTNGGTTIYSSVNTSDDNVSATSG